MIIVPKALVTDFLLGSDHNVGGFRDLLQRLHVCFKTRNKDHHVRELIVQTCQNHLKQAYSDTKTKDLFMGPIAIGAIFIADQTLFRNAVSSVTNGFDESAFFNLGELICFRAPLIPEDE